MSRADEEPRIVAIVPALPGWWVVWRDELGETLEPVPVFALVESSWHEREPGGAMQTRRVQWSQAMTHAGDGGCTLALADQCNGYHALRYYAPGNEPMPAWGSDITP